MTSVTLLLLLRGLKGNEIVNAENGNGGFCGGAQGLDLDHGGFKDTSLLVVTDNPGFQVQAVPLEALLLGVSLGGVVVRPELGHKVNRVLGRVHREHLRDDQQGLRELGNRQLLTRSLMRKNKTKMVQIGLDYNAEKRDEGQEKKKRKKNYQSGGIVFQVDGNGSLDTASSGDDPVGLKGPLYHTEGIVERSLHLVEHHLVGSTQDDG